MYNRPIRTTCFHDSGRMASDRVQYAGDAFQMKTAARPLIAVTTSEIRDHRSHLTPQGEPPLARAA
jgi:hypothetical protein